MRFSGSSPLIEVHHDLGLALQVRVLLRPAERLVDLHGRAQRGEDVAVALRVHRLHERDVGVDGLFVLGQCVGDQADRADGALDGVQQRQAGEHAHRELFLVGRQRVPGRDVVGHRNLLRQPEITGQPLPDLGVLVVLHAVPVDRRDTIDQLHSVGHQNLISPAEVICQTDPAGRTRHYPWCRTTSANTTTCVACRRTKSSPHLEKRVLRAPESSGLQPVLPGHSAPQRPVHAVLVQVPALAAAGVPHGPAPVVLQLRVERVLRRTRRGASACAPRSSTAAIACAT